MGAGAPPGNGNSPLPSPPTRKLPPGIAPNRCAGRTDLRLSGDPGLAQDRPCHRAAALIGTGLTAVIAAAVAGRLLEGVRPDTHPTDLAPAKPFDLLSRARPSPFVEPSPRLRPAMLLQPRPAPRLRGSGSHPTASPARASLHPPGTRPPCVHPCASRHSSTNIGQREADRLQSGNHPPASLAMANPCRGTAPVHAVLPWACPPALRGRPPAPRNRNLMKTLCHLRTSQAPRCVHLPCPRITASTSGSSRPAPAG